MKQWYVLYVSLCSYGLFSHYIDVITNAMASQTTAVSIVYWAVCSGADQRKHRSSASLAVVRGIHRWPVESTHKGTITQKMFPFDDAIMSTTPVYCKRTDKLLDSIISTKHNFRTVLLFSHRTTLIYDNVTGTGIRIPVTSFTNRIYLNLYQDYGINKWLHPRKKAWGNYSFQR